MTRLLTALIAALGLSIVGLAAAHPLLARSAGPSRSIALGYATRTYVVVPGHGNATFTLGAEKSVTAQDGSTITAFAISNPGGTADSANAAVLLFRNGSFLGWASPRAEQYLTLEAPAGNAIRVLYPIWKAADHTCCPSGHELVSYTWNGARIVASAGAPLSYGKPGAPLHLAPAGQAGPAQNLAVTSSVKTQLIAAFAPAHHVSVSEIGGTVPKSVYYGYDPATHTYWAVAYFFGAQGDSATVANSFQDAGSDGIFSRTATGAWRFRGAGFPLDTCIVPAAVRTVWAMTSSSCP